ncbi:hypothetical protein L150_00106, partial [Candida albicans Ca529L]
IFGGMEDINVPIVNSKLYRFELVGENNISVTNIVTLDLNTFTFKSVEIPNVISEKVPPIFVGFELVQINNKASYIISGGAVCYSFGSCYNSVYKLEY